MPSTPSELLQLSKDLAANATSETWQRCVISRAYYASLHATAQTFPKEGNAPRLEHESSHEEIIQRAVRYGKTFDPGRTNASQIAQALPRLKKLRNFADYDLSETLSAKEYDDVLKRAERIFFCCSEVVRLRGAKASGGTASLPTVQEAQMVTQSETAVACAEHLGELSPVADESGRPPRPTLKRVK